MTEPLSPLTRRATRLRERDRRLQRPGLRAALLRCAATAPGAFFASSPLFRLREELRLDPAMRLLDVGCGRGALLRLIDDRVGFHRAPVGVDASETLLRLGAGDDRRAAHCSRLVRATASALPFADGSFDVVLSGYVANRLPDDELVTFMLELRRVLAEGGLALLWAFAPTGNPRLDAWNARIVAAGSERPRLRSTRALMQVAELAGFRFVRDARLRPFLLPPVPRASVLVGRPPGDSAAR